MGYGYIKSTIPLNKSIQSSNVDSFIEKPDKEEALELIKDNHFTWNIGIFYLKQNILKELDLFEPDISFSNLSLQKNLFDLDFQRLDEDFLTQSS